MKSSIVLLFLLFAGLGHASIIDELYFGKERKKLIEVIKQEVKDTKVYLKREKLKKSTLDALETVPRHRFVPFISRVYAYRNRPLPIGHGQTISQPYIVAIMTDLLDLEPDDKVLEIGTGSGYQAAVLSHIVKDVYSMEIIEPLGLKAKELFEKLGYENIRTSIADGYYGWEEHAPYDAIIVTAAAGHIPPPLLDQLKPGGRMIVPVGGLMFTQQLILITKDKEGSFSIRQIMPVAFVPLTGKH